MLAQTDPLELLAQDALVPVTFNAGGTALGPSMDPSSGTRDLQPGTQVSVPLWMVRTLAERRMVNVRLPPVYSERYRRKLNAGAECVSLKNVVRARAAASDLAATCTWPWDLAHLARPSAPAQAFGRRLLSPRLPRPPTRSVCPCTRARRRTRRRPTFTRWATG